MKIEVTLSCVCGAEIEEVSDVECDKQFEHAISHRHGKCRSCDRGVICVCEGMAPLVCEGVH